MLVIVAELIQSFEWFGRKAMRVTKDTVVTLKYRVLDTDGNVIDDGKEPLVYLHGGYDGIFPRLEELIHDKAVGEKFTVKLQPEEAFGDYDENLVLVEDASLFPENIEVGMAFERVTEAGEEDVIYRITDIAEGKVVIDGNHPLAGQALVFEIEIAAVRPATAEERAHGHPHEG
jgi:FKBP-type peptidyl-prolyl cis-trans isomerase SlyD